MITELQEASPEWGCGNCISLAQENGHDLKAVLGLIEFSMRKGCDVLIISSNTESGQIGKLFILNKTDK